MATVKHLRNKKGKKTKKVMRGGAKGFTRKGAIRGLTMNAAMERAATAKRFKMAKKVMLALPSGKTGISRSATKFPSSSRTPLSKVAFNVAAKLGQAQPQQASMQY